MKYILVTAVILLTGILGLAQEVEVEGEVDLSGIFSSEDNVPFWAYTNTSTARGTESTFSGIASATATYAIGDATLEGGTAWFYRNELPDEFQRRDLYLQFKNNWLKVTLGAKRQDEEAEGLSATNKNFLWSGNARPLPGLLIEANDPVRITDVFSVDWGIGHYALNDERYVNDVMVHYKRLGVIMTFNENSILTARLQHFAMWGGTSPLYGELRNNFDAFLDVFFANRASETGDDPVTNRAGNHLGSYYVEYELGTNAGRFNFYHEHPFEDGSGTRLDNFPDGVWGVLYSPENKKIVDAVLYEYIDTSDQSGRGPASGSDGYFGNNVYRSGWSYEGNVIGVPFVLFDRTLVINDLNSPYFSNRARAHHLGVKGSVSKINWQARATIVTFLGTYRNPLEPKIDSFFTYAEASYDTGKYGEFRLILGADAVDPGDSVFAGGVGYRYGF